MLWVMEDKEGPKSACGGRGDPVVRRRHVHRHRRLGGERLIEVNVEIIVREVEEECRLPLETNKEEILHLRKSKKKNNADRRYVKWLGVIFGDSLDFDMHWKARISKAH